MNKTAQTNLEMVKLVASRLDYLLDKVVFLGGATTGLLITNAALPGIRSTLDVDVMIEITSRVEYYQLEKSLRKLGFKQPSGEDIPICRWFDRHFPGSGWRNILPRFRHNSSGSDSKHSRSYRSIRKQCHSPNQHKQRQWTGHHWH